jgi:hypothetical protein
VVEFSTWHRVTPTNALAIFTFLFLEPIRALETLRSFKASAWCTRHRWLKCHATHNKIFICSCNTIQFDKINKGIILLWLHNRPHRSRHVVTCSRQSLAPLSAVECKDVFSTGADCVHCRTLPATPSYLTCQKVFRKTFPKSPVTKKNQQYLIWWTVCMVQEACRTENVSVEIWC